MYKGTPKSCSCSMCRRGKGHGWGNATMKYAEKAYRQSARVALKKGSEVIAPAPYSDYTD